MAYRLTIAVSYSIWLYENKEHISAEMNYNMGDITHNFSILNKYFLLKSHPGITFTKDKKYMLQTSETRVSYKNDSSHCVTVPHILQVEPFFITLLSEIQL